MTDEITKGLQYLQTLDIVIDSMEEDIKKLKKDREAKKKERTEYMSELLDIARRL